MLVPVLLLCLAIACNGKLYLAGRNLEHFNACPSGFNKDCASGLRGTYYSRMVVSHEELFYGHEVRLILLQDKPDLVIDRQKP